MRVCLFSFATKRDLKRGTEGTGESEGQAADSRHYQPVTSGSLNSRCSALFVKSLGDGQSETTVLLGDELPRVADFLSQPFHRQGGWLEQVGATERPLKWGCHPPSAATLGC